MVDKTTGGNSAPNQSQDEGNASEELVTKSELMTIINSAITNRNKAFEKTFETKFDERFSKLETLIAPKEAQGEAPKVKQDKTDDPQVSALKKQVELLNSERGRIRDQHLRNSVRDHFAKKGVHADALDPLVALHVDSKKAISYASDDSDEIIFKIGDQPYLLSDGVSEWLKSDSAKIFKAPSGAAGSGDKAYQTRQETGNGKGSQDQQFVNSILGMFQMPTKGS